METFVILDNKLSMQSKRVKSPSFSMKSILHISTLGQG